MFGLIAMSCRQWQLPVLDHLGSYPHIWHMTHSQTRFAPDLATIELDNVPHISGTRESERKQ